MSRRYLFFCPDRKSSSGGIAVIYDIVAQLMQSEPNIHIVHTSPNAGYRNATQTEMPLCYTPELKRPYRTFVGRRAALKANIAIFKDRLRPKTIPKIDITPDDILIVPDMMLTKTILAFPENRIGLFVQNTFALQRAIANLLKVGISFEEHIAWAWGVSDICMEQIKMLGLAPHWYLPVSMEPERFPFRADKDDLITYMPRKRPHEAAYMHKVLESRGKLNGHKIIALNKMSSSEVSDHLQRSRFFISLQKNESIGFPAAEAMAAGAITVGYTGLGGRFYFTPETGIPVTEDDTTALIEAIEATVAEYSADPARLDALRAHASAEINRRFSIDQFHKSLAEIWTQVKAL